MNFYTPSTHSQPKRAKVKRKGRRERGESDIDSVSDMPRIDWIGDSIGRRSDMTPMTPRMFHRGRDPDFNRDVALVKETLYSL
jgi:hypothetical protein